MFKDVGNDGIQNRRNSSAEPHENGAASRRRTEEREEETMSLKRLHQAFDMTYKCLRQKINGGCIRVESEASLQLQFAAILKSVGELLEIDRREHF